MVKVNGKNLDLAGLTLEEYLLSAGYDLARVAVECNGEIVPKAQYSQMTLKDGDSVEVVSFVGGG
ncbi:MAG: sulfur carrier protein ThiS [Hespellia sp.]|nr:sulfur carrier protein ThiS [Hespellia sp.]